MKQFNLIVILFTLISCQGEVSVEIASDRSIKNYGELNLEEVTIDKLSVSNAEFEGSTDSNDCGYYLIGIKGSQRPSTFVYNNKVYFSMPCKTSDSSAGGWHWGMMNWTPGNMNFIDGDGVKVGINEMLTRSSLDDNGFILNSNRNTYFVDTGSGLKGLSFKYFRASDYSMANVPALFQAKAVVPSNNYYSIGFSTSTPEAMTPSDFFVDEAKGATMFSLEDNSWKGETLKESELHYEDGLIYTYITTRNSPSDDKYYISVASSSDMINFNMPSNFILEDYRYPQVFTYKEKLFLIVFDLIKLKWVIMPGTSPTNFDESKAVEIEIGSKIYGSGDWDDTPSFTSLGADEPELAGVEVLDGKIYIFYMAGQFGHVRAPMNGVSGAPYDSARGIGVMELKL
jgi:hypothetical protein